MKKTTVHFMARMALHTGTINVWRDSVFASIEEEDDNSSVDSFDPKASPLSPLEGVTPANSLMT